MTTLKPITNAKLKDLLRQLVTDDRYDLVHAITQALNEHTATADAVAPAPAPLALPEVSEPAHTPEQFLALMQDQYLPGLTSRGISEFRNCQFRDWLKQQAVLTKGDLEIKPGKNTPVFQQTLSRTLTQAQKAKLIRGMAHGSTRYEILLGQNAVRRAFNAVQNAIAAPSAIEEDDVEVELEEESFEELPRLRADFPIRPREHKTIHLY